MRPELLAFTAFPVGHWKKMWSTDPLERWNKRSNADPALPATAMLRAS